MPALTPGARDRLRAAIDAGPHTQASLARTAGISPSVITMLLSGARDSVAESTALALAKALNVKATDLFHVPSQDRDVDRATRDARLDPGSCGGTPPAPAP